MFAYIEIKEQIDFDQGEKTYTVNANYCMNVPMTSILNFEVVYFLDNRIL